MVRSLNKDLFGDYIRAFRSGDAEKRKRAVIKFYAPDAKINIAHPFNDMVGPQPFNEVFLASMVRSFDGLERQDYIVMGGIFEDNHWVASTGYYYGHFHQPWLGIKPTGALAYVRFCEYHRMLGGQAIESCIYLDIPELMIAAGQWPIKDSPGRDRGYTGLLQGPPVDGVNWGESDPERSASSVAMVTDMLRSLATKDEAWRPYWHSNMIWYGPAAFGSFIGIENFAGFQVPFESAFEGWSGGASGNGMTVHATRFADGDFICTAGWPSLTGVHVKPFLDQPATNKRVFMRVCDFWRREGDLLRENWVFVDIPDVLLQLGYDVLPEHGL